MFDFLFDSPERKTASDIFTFSYQNGEKNKFFPSFDSSHTRFPFLKGQSAEFTHGDQFIRSVKWNSASVLVSDVALGPAFSKCCHGDVMFKLQPF